jgi:hypothetical protein
VGAHKAAGVGKAHIAAADDENFHVISISKLGAEKQLG